MYKIDHQPCKHVVSEMTCRACVECNIKTYSTNQQCHCHSFSSIHVAFTSNYIVPCSD